MSEEYSMERCKKRDFKIIKCKHDSKKATSNSKNEHGISNRKREKFKMLKKKHVNTLRFSTNISINKVGGNILAVNVTNSLKCCKKVHSFRTLLMF